MLNLIRKWGMNHKKLVSVALVLVLAISLSVGLSPQARESLQKGLTIGASEGLDFFTIGTETCSAAVDVDYLCDGTADNVQFQAALNALNSSGGELHVLAGTYNFAATVSRAIDDVTIRGVGKATYFAYNGSTALFSAGSQDGWLFADFATDAGGITVSSATNYLFDNIWIGSQHYGATRTMTVVVVASDAPDKWQAQADYICDGTNDEVQINDAIIECGGGGGGIVQLSEGTFSLDGYVSGGSSTYGPCIDMVYSGVTLKGMGMYATELEIGTHGYNIIDMENDYTSIADFEIDCGNQTDRDYVYCVGTNHPGVSGVSNISVRNIYCHNGYEECRSYGIAPTEWRDYIIDGCRVEYFADDGIHPGCDLTNYGYNYRITNNIVRYCNEGIKCRGNMHFSPSPENYLTIEQGIISHNICEFNGFYGNNPGYSPSGYGIIVQNQSVIIDSNICNWNRKSGIQLDYIKNSVVTNNICMNNDSLMVYGYGRGIEIIHSPDAYVLINSNNCSDNQDTDPNALTSTSSGTTVYVTNGEYFFINQYVHIYNSTYPTGEYEWVAAVSGDTITLSGALTNTYNTTGGYLEGVATQKNGIFLDDYLSPATSDVLAVGNICVGNTSTELYSGTGNTVANNLTS